MTRWWVVAVRPRAQPTRPYKYIAGAELTLELAEATHHNTLDKALILASQVRLLAGEGYEVEVKETETPPKG